MDDVFAFAATSRSSAARVPPSFVPTTIMEQMLDDIKDARSRAGGGK